MVLPYGYVLEDSDYPEVPIVVGYEGEWERYDDEITEDIVITAWYYEADPHTVTFHITYPSSSSSTGTDEAKANSVAWNREKRKVWYVLFSASGFTEELKNEAAPRNDLELCEG